MYVMFITQHVEVDIIHKPRPTWCNESWTWKPFIDHISYLFSLLISCATVPVDYLKMPLNPTPTCLSSRTPPSSYKVRGSHSHTMMSNDGNEPWNLILQPLLSSWDGIHNTHGYVFWLIVLIVNIDNESTLWIIMPKEQGWQNLFFLQPVGQMIFSNSAGHKYTERQKKLITSSGRRPQ